LKIRLILILAFFFANAPFAIGGDFEVSPVFSNAQDAPQFQIDFTNTSKRPVELPKLIRESSIVLDGKEYPHLILKFGGNANLESGGTWKYLFDLDSYVLGAQKGGFSNLLNRWRWKTTIESGKHTLVLKFAGQTSSLITFIWEGDGPLLYE
jgi:hypothetical protein